MSETIHDLVVVGAGPVGLTLALAMLRRGFSVRVLEKEPGTAEHSRAPAIWPGTQEILARFGVIDRFLAESILLPRIEMWDADRKNILLTLPIDTFSDETVFAQLMILPQSKTERFLHEAISDEFGPAVGFDSEVVELHQDRTGVEVVYRKNGHTRTMRGRFVAGCDGASSTVREAIGGSLEGITYEVRAALADVEPQPSPDPRGPRLTTEPSLAIAIPIDDRVWRLILPYSADDDARIDSRVRHATRSIFGTSHYTTLWQSEFRLHRRVSSRWLDRRIVLAGDAAHLNSPVGGEGMNAGIRDAAVLAEHLADALESNEPQTLESYVSQRRASVEGGVNRFTDRLTKVLLFGQGRLIRPAMRLASLAMKIAPLRRRFLRRTAMLE